MNYEIILLPEFNTSSMVRKRKKGDIIITKDNIPHTKPKDKEEKKEYKKNY